MYETFKVFNQVNTQGLEGKQLEEVVKIFRDASNDRERNRCFTYIFKQVYPAILRISSKYTSLDYCERIELACEWLYYAIIHFKLDKKIKFLTFFYGNLDRCYTGVVNSHKCAKRQAWYAATKYAPRDLDYALSKIKAPNKVELFESLVNDLDNSILNSTEAAICKGLAYGYKTNEELTNFLLSTKNEYNITNPINISKVKKSIREKVKANNYSLWI